MPHLDPPGVGVIGKFEPRICAALGAPVFLRNWVGRMVRMLSHSPSPAAAISLGTTAAQTSAAAIVLDHPSRLELASQGCRTDPIEFWDHTGSNLTAEDRLKGPVDMSLKALSVSHHANRPGPIGKRRLLRALAHRSFLPRMRCLSKNACMLERSTS